MPVPQSYLAQIMAARAQGGQPQGITPQPSEADLLYQQLMAQSMTPPPPPSIHERIASGLRVPDAPIRKRKGREGRLLLRGLVEGYKGSQGFASPGQGVMRGQFAASRGFGGPRGPGGGGGRYVNQEYEAARTAAARALEAERLARAAQTNEPDDIDPLLEDKRAAIQALRDARLASKDAAGRRASAYEKRMGRAPAGGGGRGGSPAAYNAERATLKARHDAVLSRLKAAATNYWGETEGQYAKPLAIAGRARLVNKAEQEYRRLLDELDKKYGMGVEPPDDGEERDEDLYP